MEQYTKDDLIKDLETRLEKIHHVIQLKQHKGWNVVKEHFNKILEAIQLQLLKEEDSKKVLRYQERYRAFSSMLQAVDCLCKEKDVCERELDAIKNDY